MSSVSKDGVTYWPLVEAYFREKGFAKQEIDSFNQFVDQKLSQIVDENKTIVPKIEEVKLELSNIEVERSEGGVNCFGKVSAWLSAGFWG